MLIGSVVAVCVWGEGGGADRCLPSISSFPPSRRPQATNIHLAKQVYKKKLLIKAGTAKRQRAIAAVVTHRQYQKQCFDGAGAMMEATWYDAAFLGVRPSITRFQKNHKKKRGGGKAFLHTAPTSCAM